MLENSGEPYLDQTVTALRPLMDDDVTRAALDILRRDYLAPDAVGIMRAAEFLSRTKDEAYRADRAGAVRELRRLME